MCRGNLSGKLCPKISDAIFTPIFKVWYIVLQGVFCMQWVNTQRRDETRCQLTLCSL